jgi:glycosyltransferase involved in cell wall biosynthesis
MLVCQGDLTGASEKQALGWSTQLAAAGHSVLLSLRGDRSSGDRESAHVPGLTLSWRHHLGPRLTSPVLAEAREFAPEVIHAFNPRVAVLQPSRQLARATGAPVFVHWEDDEWSIRRGPAGRSLYRRLGRLGRRVLCHVHPPQGVFVTSSWLRWTVTHARGFDALTPALAERVTGELGRPCAVILPVMPAADWGVERTLAAELPGAAADRPLLMFTGEIHPGSYDDVILGLRAVALVQRRGHRVAFGHAGTSLPRYDLTRMAGQAGMEPGTAVGLGYFPFAELPPLLRRASILLQPGRPIDYNRLRLPSKMQAYLASGTPTITFATGFAEMLEDRVEVLKTYGDAPEELADRIVELLNDQTLRTRLSGAAPQAAARLFDPVGNAERLVGHYQHCLRPAGQPGRPPAVGAR